MPLTIPAELESRCVGSATWSDWLDGLPRVVDALLQRWDLSLAGAATAGRRALIVPVIDADGVRRALKVGCRDGEKSGEVATLQLWGGRHAARLLRADPQQGAMLLEWLDGHLDAMHDTDVTPVVAGLFQYLHRPAAPQLRDLHFLIGHQLDTLVSRGRTIPAPPRLVDQAVTAGRRLVAAPGTHVLHGDLHSRNVLQRDEAWVVINPQGYNGDPCFEPGPLLWTRWAELESSGNVGEAIRDRFFTIIDTAGLDERRARDWVVVRSMLNVAGLGVHPDGIDEQPTTDRAWITRNVTIAKVVQALEL